jgi:hypothetical protein
LDPGVVALDVQGITHSLIIEVIGHRRGTCQLILLHAFLLQVWPVCVPVLQPWGVLVLVDAAWVGHLLSAKNCRAVFSFARGVGAVRGISFLLWLDIVVLAEEVVRIQLIEHVVNPAPVLSADLWLLRRESIGV